MMTKKPLLFHLLVMLAYSVFCILAYPLLGENMIGLNWFILCLHIVLLLIFGLVRLSDTATRSLGGKLLLASLLVAIIGHGLCFFNGLVHFGSVH